jgi:serine/threonine-protein kinase
LVSAVVVETIAGDVDPRARCGKSADRMRGFLGKSRGWLWYAFRPVAEQASAELGARAPTTRSGAPTALVEFERSLGRYALFGEIASGGMATIHLARLVASVGFARTVAIKRLHPHLGKDPDFVSMFLEEARLAARVRHPNVVATLDVVSEDGELFLVMEYVPGESLSRLIRRMRESGGRVPPRLAVGMLCGALDGLEAAHEATSERGAPLGIVHRDVSPQNIQVGLDGVARLLDFGIAKATNRVQETRSDQIKGKVQYMSPEQLAKGPIDRRADVYSASVVLWEALTGQRLFKADDVPSLVYAIMNDEVDPPSALVPDLPAGLDEIVMRGLDREASQRWSSAREMAVELERVVPPAPPREIGEWVRATAGEALAWRLDLVHRIESESSTSLPPPEPHSMAPPGEASSGVLAHGRTAAKSDSDHDPPSVTGVATATALRTSSQQTVRIAVVAVGLVVAGAVALVARVIQLQGGLSAAPSAQAPEAETAIGLGIARPAASAPATRSAPRLEPSAPAPALRAAPTVDCEDPFTTDAKGFRHPKPACFKR